MLRLLLQRWPYRSLRIAITELEGAELTEDDYNFIRDFGSRLDSVICGVEAKGKETTIVADVHTDTNSPQEVLEEGVGYVGLILAAYKSLMAESSSVLAPL
ncbi:MAG: DUF3160 domain-containing protein [Dehalococcoidia bacterium]|nr:MAG: DUF3160 domain-containing protein [Dehalococcoidia bacterium]